MNWIGFCKVESPTVETFDFFFRYVTVCFGTWNLTLLYDSWYVIRAASLILNVAFSRKWPCQIIWIWKRPWIKHPSWGYPTYLEDFLKNEHGHIWDVPNSPPGQWKTFAVQVATNRPKSSECGVPEFFFRGLLSESKKRNRSNWN